MRVTEGGILPITQTFLDDDGLPLQPTEFGAGPLVRAITGDGEILFEGSAAPDLTPGSWTCDVAYPVMGLEDELPVTVIWVFDSEQGRERVSQQVVVEPESRKRITNITAYFDEPGETVYYEVTVPWVIRDGDKLKMVLSLNNEIIGRYTNLDTDVELVAKLSDRTTYRLPLSGWPPIVAPYSLSARIDPVNPITGNMVRNTQYTLWTMNPQIGVAMTMLQDFIDRARLENVIPELEYVESDLLGYLYRGLAMFNSLPPRATNFTGVNMQGPMLDAWVTCASIHALAAQFLAEGSLAFDFSGQTVSLNMDRTPAIEATLGRLENQLNTIVMPYKKLLGRAGEFEGDGSIGGRRVDGAQKMGVLGVTVSPTTRYGASSIHGQQRMWMRAHYGIRR